MLENVETGQIRGTCQIFGAVGTDRPFYSYLISTLTQKSEELGRIFRNQTLNLTTDLEGFSEGRRPVPPTRRNAPAASVCCSPGRATCSSSSTGRGLAIPSWLSCAESWTKPAIRRSGMQSAAASSE
jgi:hypothetical protein